MLSSRHAGISGKLPTTSKFGVMKRLLLTVIAGALWPIWVSALETTADFEAEIAKQGEKKFVRRICQSPEWGLVLKGVERGDANWLRIAGRLRPYTDAGCSSELETALFSALPNSAESVLAFLGAYRGPKGTFSIESVCGDKSLGEPVEHYRSVLDALGTVNTPSSPRTMQLCTAAAKAALERARQNGKS